MKSNQKVDGIQHPFTSIKSTLNSDQLHKKPLTSTGCCPQTWYECWFSFTPWILVCCTYLFNHGSFSHLVWQLNAIERGPHPVLSYWCYMVLWNYSWCYIDGLLSLFMVYINGVNCVIILILLLLVLLLVFLLFLLLLMVSSCITKTHQFRCLFYFKWIQEF